MTESFWYDAPSKTLVYPGTAPSHVAPLLEGVKQNGKYWAVPHHLRNAIVLRHFNFPVAPIMDDYDFPIEPGRKPLPHQKVYANFSVMHPKSFNLGDPGCVAGDTLIETDSGPKRIDLLTMQGTDIRVYASTAEGVRLVAADCPFVKGFEPIYRVTFASGRTIDVTSRHLFLTCRGWVSCANLVVGEPLPKFDVAQPVSISESYLSTLRQDARHSKQTIPDFQEHFRSCRCGVPLLPDEDSAPTLAPSQADFPLRSLLGSRTGARGTIYKRTARTDGVHRSKLGYAAPTSRGSADAYQVAESTSKPAYIQFRDVGLYRQSSSRLRPWPLDSEAAFDCAHCPEHNEFCASAHGSESLCSSHPSDLPPAGYRVRFQVGAESSRPELPCDFPVDTIASIRYLKTDFYYDMHVPVHENYIAHGVCNHNTMKTLATLWAADYLMQQFPPGTTRFLIVAPLTILDTVWASAIFRNLAGRRSFKILIGDEARRIKLLAEPADFYIVNPDGLKVGARARPKRELRGFSQALADRSDIRGIIIDEASGFKDHTTFRWWCFHKAFGDRPFLWQLTGTPTPNRPTDAYGLAKLVNNCFGKSFQGFQLESMIKVSLYKWVPQKDGYDKARRLLVPSVRYSLDDVWDGPEMTIQRRKVDLTDEQKKLMLQLKNELQIQTKAGPIDAANEAAARQKFIQISLGAVYDAQHNTHLVDASPRYREIEDIIDGTQRKVLIFVTITSVIHVMIKHLMATWKKEGVPHRCGFINGEVAPSKRPALIRDFEADPNFKVMFADPQATAHGINEFVVADTVIWASATDKAELWIQGNRRVRRPGQLYPSVCFQIVSNKLEEEIFDRLETNTGMQGLMLDAIREGKF